jgi:hypothetical protein
MKKFIKGILGLILVTFITITVYYYFQHTIEITYYPVNERIRIEDQEFIVKYISKTDFKKEFRGFPWWTGQEALINSLPPKVYQWLSKVSYFYSKPYAFNDDSYNYNIHLEVLNDTLSIEENSGIQDIKVSLIDREADRSYTSLSQTISRSDRSTSMLLVAEIEDEPDIEHVSLSFQLEEDGQEETIEVTQEPETRQFNFFNRYDIIENLTADHVAAEFLNDLMSIEAPTYDLQYVGNYEQYEEVYKMVIRNREEVNQSEITLHMIYEDFQWQVIGVNGEI